MTIPPDLEKLILSVRSDRANPLPKYRRPNPRPDPAAKKLLASLRRRLASATSRQLPGLVAGVQASHPPAVVTDLIDSVIATLLRARGAPAGTASSRHWSPSAAAPWRASASRCSRRSTSGSR